MSREAIILCGGRGSRLGHLTEECPKPMLPIGNIPFLNLLLSEVYRAGVKHIILATGYLADEIDKNTLSALKNFDRVSFSRESEPLGTAGAIGQAMEYVQGNSAIVMNGDSIVSDLVAVIKKIVSSPMPSCDEISLVYVQIDDVQRFGAINLQNEFIIGFEEKNANRNEGFISAGIYHMQKDWLSNISNPASIEQYFEHYVQCGNPIRAIKSKGEFIDIGIPEDYERAKSLAWLTSLID